MVRLVQEAVERLVGDMLGVLDAVMDNETEEDAVDPDHAREGVVHGGEQVAHPRDGKVLYRPRRRTSPGWAT